MGRASTPIRTDFFSAKAYGEAWHRTANPAIKTGTRKDVSANISARRHGLLGNPGSATPGTVAAVYAFRGLSDLRTVPVLLALSSPRATATARTEDVVGLRAHGQE